MLFRSERPAGANRR